jgi:hypothetical protein
VNHPHLFNTSFKTPKEKEKNLKENKNSAAARAGPPPPPPKEKKIHKIRLLDSTNGVQPRKRGHPIPSPPLQ